MGYIYKITNKINGKVYIGQTSESIEQRWKEHQNASKYEKYKDYNSMFHCALRKYGFNNFSVEKVEEVDNNLLNSKETYWINFYDSYKSGYNMTLGGEGSRTIDYYIIYKLWDEGYGITDISDIAHCSDVQAREILKGYPNYSKDESFSRGARINKKCVSQYDLDGNLVNKYESASDASRICGISVSNILAVCNFNQKTAGGFQWRFDSSSPEMNIPSGNKKSVNQFYPDGTLKATFSSITDAAKSLNCSTSAIAKACRKESESSHGYIWRFVGDDFDVNCSKTPRIRDRSIVQYTLDGTYVNTFIGGIKQAVKIMGVSYDSIYNACVGTSKSSCGFTWKFQ